MWTLAAAARCRGLLANESTFAEAFEEALEHHERTPSPFERARTQLCYGERLRRAHKLRRAQTLLDAAIDTFGRLGAAPWTERGRRELAATGRTMSSPTEDSIRELTPHELQLALVVSRGATNKEATAALFISPKTVESHLHRIYLKLGLRSRTELAHRLARLRMLD